MQVLVSSDLLFYSKFSRQQDCYLLLVFATCVNVSIVNSTWIENTTLVECSFSSNSFTLAVEDRLPLIHSSGHLLMDSD